eukprot:1157704-Amphidinium_carterae.2
MSYGALRYTHVQRSSIVSVDGNSIHGSYSKGKASVGGARPGFSWSFPRYGVTGVDLAADRSF